MEFTQSDLADFHEFAERQLSIGHVADIDELTRQWKLSRETAEVVQAIREGEAEFEAGGGRPAGEVIAELREKLSGQ